MTAIDDLMESNSLRYELKGHEANSAPDSLEEDWSIAALPVFSPLLLFACTIQTVKTCYVTSFDGNPRAQMLTQYHN